MASHEKYIRRCFELAKKGLGNTSPNPLVGSVVVHNDRIIGEGYHKKAGTAHAEVNAIASVEDTALLPGSTIYVNLEPCSHQGLTPPCADLIIEKNIARVVISNLDPNPVVSGNGVSRLKQAGIEVITGVLEAEGDELNRRFFTLHRYKRPYVILKWAQSEDGFIDKDRDEDEKGVFWISSPDTQRLTHQWRAHEDAILVGNRTVMIDDPSLTTRQVHGSDPIRVVIDPNDKIVGEFKVFDGSAPTLIFNSGKIISGADSVEYSSGSVEDILKELGSRQVTSVIVEGGKATLISFIESGLWDEARVITGSSSLGKGLKAPQLDTKPVKSNTFAGDTINIYRNK